LPSTDGILKSTILKSTILKSTAGKKTGMMKASRIYSASSLAFCLLATLNPIWVCGQSELDTKRLALVEKSVRFLTTQQSPNGSFSGQTGPAITAIITTGLINNGVLPSEPVVQRSLEYLATFVQKSGGIHQKETFYKNYETSLSLICFVAANESGKYSSVIKRAENFLKGLQTKEGSSDPTDVEYGGIGYGKHQRPDLSNTSTLVDALKAAGNGADDEAMKRALAFISRCQNLESEKNMTPFAAKVNDGGLYYTPAAGGQSQAGQTQNGGLKSYGSMTYAGLKSMIFAGVDREDPRVQGALGWIKNHYSLTQNPGMGRGNLGAQGLYYYFQVFGKALDAVGIEEVVDAKGNSHRWRGELLAELAKRQRPDGSWVNSESDRWMEGDSNLVTGYALLALSYCKNTKEKKSIKRPSPTPRD
jgi:squalene-hopene/tetraprenyl-beta-curcumene cyclase